MKISLLIIVILVSIGFLFSATSLGQQGFLTSLFTAFGLLCLVGILSLIFLSKKRKK
ncbi:LPXTG cell wall anchor domain-containing protein [Paraglaciecola sp.]|uniref:LPXTG cell wall anchor domain-containing protein n=1 Tax=Paraglaciecola sp. TaxID=1920173 RepID=UPI0030F46006